MYHLSLSKPQFFFNTYPIIINYQDSKSLNLRQFIIRTYLKLRIDVFSRKISILSKGSMFLAEKYQS